MTRCSKRQSDAGGPPGDHVNRMIVTRGHKRQLVLFWVQGHGDKMPADGVALSLLSLRTRLVGAGDDGSLVRLSTPIDTRDDEPAERHCRASLPK